MPRLKKEAEAFFIHMGKKKMENEQDKDIRLDLDKPEDDVVQEEERVDGCPKCSGEGLLNQEKVCDMCLGTGRRGDAQSEFPDGTMQLRPGEGRFIMKQGQWVKDEV